MCLGACVAIQVVLWFWYSLVTPLQFPVWSTTCLTGGLCWIWYLRILASVKVPSVLAVLGAREIIGANLMCWFRCWFVFIPDSLLVCTFCPICARGAPEGIADLLGSLVLGFQGSRTLVLAGILCRSLSQKFLLLSLVTH